MFVICCVKPSCSATARLRGLSSQLTHLFAFSLTKRVFRDALKSALSEFPHHLLSAVYCIGIIPVFIFIILKNKKAKILSCIISAAALAVILVYTFALNTSYIMAGNVLLDGIGNIQLDESCEVEVSDEAVSKAWIEEDYQGDYQLMMEFYKYDTNTVTITDANGNETVIEIYLDEDKNYRISKK